MSKEKGASTPSAHSGQRAEQRMASELAQHLGARYRDYKLIGSGGYATVWRALDSVNNQFVAIKRFNPHPDLSSRFSDSDGIGGFLHLLASTGRSNEKILQPVF